MIRLVTLKNTLSIPDATLFATFNRTGVNYGLGIALYAMRRRCARHTAPYSEPPPSSLKEIDNLVRKA